MLTLEKVVDPQATHRLAAATVLCAPKDAGGRRGADRVEAIAWLASTRATIWLDLLDIQQSTLLTRCGWMDWVREVEEDLGNLPYLANEDVIDTICRTLTYLEDLQARQTAVFD